MQKSQEADFNLTHSIVNYLNAQYRAHFAFVNALLQLASPDVTPDIVKKTQNNLATAIKWNQDLYAGLPIFSVGWKYPETFEAQKAFDLLGDVQSDIKKISDILRAIAEEPNPLSKPEDLKFLIAINLRFAYGRENYMKGFVEYGKSRGNGELQNAYANELAEASEEIKSATLILKEVKETGAISEAGFEKLLSSLPTIRCIFLSYLHDINVYLAIYEPTYTFERAGFTEQETLQWKNVQFDARTAGYWKAYSFRPEEAADWFSVNITDPSAAFVWKINNFSPDEALAWISLGILPKLALDLIKHGQTPESVYHNLTKFAEKNAA